MKSIQGTLFSFSILLISALGIVFIFFIFIHLQIVNDYKKITYRIILEQNIPKYTSDMVLNYYYYVIDPTNKQKQQTYQSSLKKISDAFDYLDREVTTGESLVQYRGLKSITNGIKNDLAKGITQSKQGNILRNSVIYEKANHDSEFVKEATGTLILKELDFTEQFETNLQRTHTIILSVSIAIFIFFYVGGIFFALRFSIRIASPLTKLSLFSQKIAEGFLDQRIDMELLKKDDETGILARAYESMVNKLKNKINLIEQSEKNIKTINEDLEKMNKVMVGRELKMIELKKQIAQLESQHPNTTPPQTPPVVNEKPETT